jgi:hypothetical protein
MVFSPCREQLFTAILGNSHNQSDRAVADITPHSTQLHGIYSNLHDSTLPLRMPRSIKAGIERLAKREGDERVLA